MTDLEKELENVSNVPKLHLSQKVRTQHGIGIIVNLNIPFNGLYLSPERAEAVVWYGTEKNEFGNNRWVSFTHKLQDIYTIEKTKD